jgi:hypothetical protein
LVERLLYTQDVGGSSPSSPTNLRRAAVQVARRSLKGEGGLYGAASVGKPIYAAK